jgi:ectoine hydroxylase-related dioxygenase (phytanoyl-CoA dioxygenase family)
VALTDTPTGHGGFRCVPGWHRHPERWPQSPIRFPSHDEWHASVSDGDIVSVPMNRGDVVLWSSRLPHSNSKNVSNAPRYAFYVQMLPHTATLASELSECWETGLCHGAWNDLPGHQHTEPWALVALSPLGRKLVGIDS